MSALIHHEVIKTTVPKAKETARLAEKVRPRTESLGSANRRLSRTASATPTRLSARLSPTSS